MGVPGLFRSQGIDFFEIIGDVEKSPVAIKFVRLIPDILPAWKSSPIGLVVTENPVTRLPFLPLKLREETPAINRVTFSGSQPRGLDEGGIEIGKIDEVV